MSQTVKMHRRGLLCSGRDLLLSETGHGLATAGQRGACSVAGEDMDSTLSTPGWYRELLVEIIVYVRYKIYIYIAHYICDTLIFKYKYRHVDVYSTLESG